MNANDIRSIIKSLTQKRDATYFRDTSLQSRYSLGVNLPVSGVGGLTQAVNKVLELEKSEFRCLIADSYQSAFNLENELNDNEIRILQN